MTSAEINAKLVPILEQLEALAAEIRAGIQTHDDRVERQGFTPTFRKGQLARGKNTGRVFVATGDSYVFDGQEWVPTSMGPFLLAGFEVEG